MDQAVVLFSGGQDSTTCLAWARELIGEPIALSFFYGQRHMVELDVAKDTCEAMGIERHVIDLRDAFAVIGGSALTSKMGEIKLVGGDLPTSFVPGRNILFMAIASAFAKVRGIDSVVTGICDTDFSGYPDCREGFRKQMEIALRLGLESGVKLIAPLMNLTKADTWAMAHELDCFETVRLGSHTCYEGKRDKLHVWGYGCGVCPACDIRRKGFEEYQQRGAKG